MQVVTNNGRPVVPNAPTVVPFKKPKPVKEKNPKAKKLTPKAAFLTEIAAIGEITDRLHGMARGDNQLTTSQIKFYRARLAPLLALMKQFDEDMASEVTGNE